jgi:hypothetical protein
MFWWDWGLNKYPIPAVFELQLQAGVASPSRWGWVYKGLKSNIKIMPLGGDPLENACPIIAAPKKEVKA